VFSLANRIKGITIEIGGDTSSLSKAISGVNSELKSTQEQLRDVDKLLKLDPENVTLLEQQQRLLNQSIEDTSKKLEILKTAETQVQEKFKQGKISRDQYDALTREVVYSEAALKKLQGRAKECEDALKGTGEAAEEVAESTEDTTKTSLNLGNALSDIAEAAGVSVPPALSGMIDKMSGVNASGLALIGTITGIVAGLASLTVETAKNAKEIDVLSQRMGMTTDQYQEWDYVLKRAGTSAEEAQGDLSALAEKAKDAASGAGEAAELFDELGINVLNNQRQLKSQNELFSEVITKLQGVTNETKRNAIASALLSTTGENLVPILNMTKEELADLKKEANDTGYVIGEQNLQAFSDLGDAMEELSLKGEAVKNGFALALLPLLTSLFDVVSKIPTPILQTIVVLAGIVSTIVLTVKTIKEMTSTANSITKFFNGFDASAMKTTAIVLSVVAALIALAAIIAVIAGKGPQLESSLNGISNSINDIQNNVQNPRYPAYASGTPFHPGGWAMVGEQGRELVRLPRGSAVYSNSATERMLAGGGDTFYITVEARNVRELNDLVRMAENARRDRRSK
jgi:phage-related minor tail protein